jgi:uroporphyrin-III C-methyltransferase
MEIVTKNLKVQLPDEPRPGGMVSLVGAGPGDPGLLTLRALDRLIHADVVYHDALVSEDVLSLIPPNVRCVAVGKRRGRHALSQRFIDAFLIRDARSGRAVVRLKGGDPFVFGRGGEEALSLLEAGVAFEVVPGISAGLGVPALGGIPLTHRGTSSSAAFVTAHDLGDNPGRSEQLARLAQSVETLVIFMGGTRLRAIRSTLLGAGLSGTTPAAVIISGTRPEERRIIRTLETLAETPISPDAGPVLVIVGHTIRHAEAIRGGMVATRWEVISRLAG